MMARDPEYLERLVKLDEGRLVYIRFSSPDHVRVADEV